MFSNEILEIVEQKINQRVLSVGDLINRKHPVLHSYKVGDSAELTRAVMNCLLTLSDAEKDQIIKTLERLKSKPI